MTDIPIEESPIRRGLARASARILAEFNAGDGVVDQLSRMQPDVLIVVSQIITGKVLSELKKVGSNLPLPVMVFTEDHAPESIEAALKAGVTSYIVDYSNPDRFDSLMGVAMARYAQQSRVQAELSEAKKALSDRKAIDRAKGILMKQRLLSEEEAYQSLRKRAMDTNMTIGEVAEQLVMAAQMLVD